jgi:hypothetical protein
MSDFRTGGIFRGALIGGIAAGVLNIGLFFVGKAAGAKFLLTQPGSPELVPIPPYQPMVNCVLGAVVAAAVMTGLTKVAGKKAWSVFVGVAAAVFLLFFTFPIKMLPGDTLSIVFLEIMHVPAAIGIMVGIWRFGRATATLPQ